MKIKLGLPYMGGKRKIAPKIINKMLADNPNAKYVYDLFGGGGSMSFEALQRPQIERVFYNELNTGVVELIRKIRRDGVTPEFYQWIDRETFDAHKSDNDWFGGLCKVVWSFGNNQRNYLFGKSIEPNKRLGHMVVVNQCGDSARELSDIFGVAIDVSSASTINERRLDFMAVITASKKRFDLEQLGRLQQLEQLEQLQQLQQLEQLERLEISNKSAFDVEILTPIGETIVYLDPPYAKTVEYAEKMSHDELREYVLKSPHLVYMSGYECDYMHEVLSVEHRSTLCAAANNKVVERLFCNNEKTQDFRLTD